MQHATHEVQDHDRFAHDERYPVFPVWLIVDTSSSMAGEPIAAVNAALPELKRLVEQDSSVGEIARIAIITFASTAICELGLSDLAFVEMPTVGSGGSTNYRDAFETTRRGIETGIRGLGTGTRFHAPVIFFMSDGQPNTAGDWTDALRPDLRAASHPRRVGPASRHGVGEGGGNRLRPRPTPRRPRPLDDHRPA